MAPLPHLLVAVAVASQLVGESCSSPTCSAGPEWRAATLLQHGVRKQESFAGLSEEGPSAGGGLVQSESEDAVAQAKARWVASGRHVAASEEPQAEEWPFMCRSAPKVCFVDNELVALDPVGDQPAQPLERPRAHRVSYWRMPDPTPLNWFQEAGVMFNMPGYNDGLAGVQNTAKPITVRAASRSMESVPLWSAPLLNVTPVIVYPTWPFNFGDTVGSLFLHTWVQWASEQPSVRGHPLAVAIPHGLRLPSFWKLAESLGPAVETFSSLSKASDKDPPLCFEEVIGCSNIGPGDWHSAIASDGGAAWESFRQALLAKHCSGNGGRAAAEAEGGSAAAQRPLVVGLVQRDRGRQLLNMRSLLQQCKLMPPVNGRQVVCRSVTFTDIQADICGLQDLDVIVGTHGAQLANALFMRPGSSLIEVRAKDWYAVDGANRLTDPNSWPNTMAQKLWLTNNTHYWWYGAEAADSFPDRRSKVPGRDSDVRVSWPVLACMLEKVAAVKGRKDFETSDLPMMKSASCREPAAEP